MLLVSSLKQENANNGAVAAASRTPKIHHQEYPIKKSLTPARFHKVARLCLDSVFFKTPLLQKQSTSEITACIPRG